MELRAASDSELTTPSQDATTTTLPAASAGKPLADAPSKTSGGVRLDAVQGARRYLREVENGLSLSGLRPCTTYRLTMEMPPIVRNDLLESARCAVGQERVISRDFLCTLRIVKTRRLENASDFEVCPGNSQAGRRAGGQAGGRAGEQACKHALTHGNAGGLSLTPTLLYPGRHNFCSHRNSHFSVGYFALNRHIHTPLLIT